MPAADALNYPYIRVRDVDWLKRSLLVFPHIVRLTPGFERGAPADDPEIAPFTFPRNGEDEDDALLRPANLNLPHVQDCQLELRDALRSRLEINPATFLARFGKDAAKRQNALGSIKKQTDWERRLRPGASFQVHPFKLGVLWHFLYEHKLAWKPERESADYRGYLEMHPDLGEAVMATLAAASAEAGGLRVVTEFPKLHGKLIGTPREEILDVCLDRPKGDSKVTGEHVIQEFIVHRRCNVDLLAQDGIYELHEERKALADFRAHLEKLAAAEFTQPIYDDDVRRGKIEALVGDLLKDWKKEQAQLAGSGRRFFGDGALAEPKKMIEKIGETLLKPEGAVAGAQGATLSSLPAGVHEAATGGHYGPVLVAAGFGFAVGVVFRGIESWQKTRQAAKDSPLRYLTMLESQGVTFTVTP
jgi:hypothetical protein